MKKIILITKFKDIFEPSQIMSYANVPLRDKLNNLGYSLEVFSGQSLKECHQIWFSDVESAFPIFQRSPFRRLLLSKAQKEPNVYAEALESGLSDRCVLFLYEPAVVKPENERLDILSQFRTVVSWNRKLHSLKNVQPMRWIPYRVQIPPVGLPHEERKLVTLIAGNKYSSQEGELYSKRREFIRTAERLIGENFDLYGMGWNLPATFLQKRFPRFTPKYVSYGGTIRGEADVLGKYRFRLVYENSCNAVNWITEKIWDTFQCGCVPIYWGAPNVSEYIPKEAFIDRRDFKSDKKLIEFLKSVDAGRYQQYLDAIARFLSSPEFEAWSVQSYVDSVLNAVGINATEIDGTCRN